MREREHPDYNNRKQEEDMSYDTKDPLYKFGAGLSY